MKWILATLLLISATALGQIGRGDDSTKYIRYQNQYGQRMPRSWWDSVAHMPYGDTTTFPKPCRPGAIMMHTDKSFYKWNGGGWETMVRVVQLTDSSFIVGDDTLIINAGAGSVTLQTKQIGYGNATNTLIGNDSLTWDNSNKQFTINKGASDSPAISIKQNYTGIKKWFNIQAPVQNDSTLDFGFYSQIAPNDDGTKSNHVLVIGSNYDFKNSLFGKNGDHWESHWRSGGVHYKERHYVVGLPNFEECRAFSSTFKIRDSLGNSDNTWDFRANVFSLKDIKSNDYFSISKGDNVPGSFCMMNISGANPIMRFTDFGTGNTHSFQYTGTGLISNGPIIGAGNGYFSAAFTAQQTGGTGGGSQFSLQKANGSNYDFRMNGTTAGGGFANDFYIYDDEHNEMPMRVKANGHFMVNGNGQSDQGQRFQVFGTGLFTDSLTLRNTWLFNTSANDAIFSTRKVTSFFTSGNNFTSGFGTINLYSALRKTDDSGDSVQVGFSVDHSAAKLFNNDLLSNTGSIVSSDRFSAFIEESGAIGVSKIYVDSNYASIEGADSILIKGAAAATPDSLLGVTQTNAQGFNKIVKTPASNYARILKGSTSWQPGTVAAGSSATTTVSVTGAALGDPVTVSKASGAYSNGELYDAFVSATNTVTIRVHNVSTGSANYNTTETYNVVLLKY